MHPRKTNLAILETAFCNRRFGMTVAPSLLLILAFLFCLPDARAALLFYDGFDYPAGEQLGGSSSSPNWGNHKDQFNIVSGSLHYPGLKLSTGNRLNIQAITPNINSVRTVDGSWPSQSNGAVYVSFVLRLHSIAEIRDTGVGTSLITLSDASNNTELLGINLRNDKTTRLGVVKYPSSGGTASSSVFFSSGQGANLSVDGSTTYLIVAKYEWVKGATNDVVTLWVNPTTLGADEDEGNKISTSAGEDGTGSAARLTLCRGPNVNIDELRIGQTWADVTPTIEPSQKWKVVMGVLAGGLIVASFWITQLRRKVKERSAALAAQIRERQKVEQQRLMEQERARIAHDLHDELGADITEIGMLAMCLQGGAGGGEEGHRRLGQMADLSRQMVAKLEEIVWAMDPQHDSLGALVSYFSFFADRFLGLANIKLIIDTSEDAKSLAVEARVRHQLFLVFKEALANVVRHSGASEVRLAVHVENRVLHVLVADNGYGLRKSDPTSGGHEGVGNMRRRVEKMGGSFEITGENSQGTTVKFAVPLDS
jgi:signal transduction histidine kinase